MLAQSTRALEGQRFSPTPFIYLHPQPDRERRGRGAGGGNEHPSEKTMILWWPCSPHAASGTCLNPHSLQYTGVHTLVSFISSLQNNLTHLLDCPWPQRSTLLFQSSTLKRAWSERSQQSFGSLIFYWEMQRAGHHSSPRCVRNSGRE